RPAIEFPDHGTAHAARTQMGCRRTLRDSSDVSSIQLFFEVIYGLRQLQRRNGTRTRTWLRVQYKRDRERRAVSRIISGAWIRNTGESHLGAHGGTCCRPGAWCTCRSGPVYEAAIAGRVPGWL